MIQNNLIQANKVVKSEVVDTVINNLEPIYMGVTFQFLVQPIDNINYLNKQLSIIDEQNKEITRLNRLLNKKRIINPEFATTEEAANYIRVDLSYITKRKGKVFQLGIHFFKPIGESIVRWSIPALSKWLTAEKNSMKNITPKLAKLLERS